MRKNCISINLKKNEILIKISEDAEQKDIIYCLKKKLPDLRKLYKDDKTPIKVAGKVLKNKEIDEIQTLIKNLIDVEIDFDMPKSLGLSSTLSFLTPITLSCGICCFNSTINNAISVIVLSKSNINISGFFQVNS